MCRSNQLLITLNFLSQDLFDFKFKFSVKIIMFDFS